MRDFVAALRGLTIRGRCFMSAGITCCATAVVIGEHDLLRIGMLLVALPVIAAAFICRTRYRLACSRRINPPRVDAGSTVSVRIRLENVSRSPSSVLLVEDEIPHRLGGRARFTLDKIEPGGSRDLSYKLRATLRGRYRIGPMSVHLTDPFGLCELSRAFRSSDELVVAPTIEKLPPARTASAAGSSVDHRSRTATSGDDDITTRPYRSGDDLRRVHWKTTARTGELMVRREKRPRVGGAAVFLDTREQAWDGPGPSTAFEWAVSAAGSLAIHLAAGGGTVRLLHTVPLNGAGVAASGTRSAATALLDELATVTTSPAHSLRTVLAALRKAAHGTLVAVLGRTDAATAASIAATRPRSAPAIAVLIDITSWGGSAAAADDLAAAQAAFTRQGWVVLVARHGTTLAELWSQLPAASAAARGGRGGGQPRAREAVPERPVEETSAW